MANKKLEMQRFARWYREQNNRDATMHEVAIAAKNAGWKMPEPKDPIDILAKEFAQAQREEMLFDEVLGESYHANICYQDQQGDQSVTFWGDINKASRKKIVKNVALRRDQMVGDALQVSIDVMHWNRVNPNEEPVQVELDFGPDVEWKLNAPKHKKAA